MIPVTLTNEQETFIKTALSGKNVLVDACIGSGKTTAIQALCDRLDPHKRVLYLTYNKLLKEDAREKIRNKNVTVTNYHGFAWLMLHSKNISCSVPEMIQTYLHSNVVPPKYDVLVVDEYQDIELEFSKLLMTIKTANPNVQIIMVGDMQQKIYDKTTLDVLPFIKDFLGKCECLTFTKCFRLKKEYAAQFAHVWDKTIEGVNTNQVIRHMSVASVINYLAAQNPGDILCLGLRTGDINIVLNKLETLYPEKFNKHNVYASIKENDSNIRPNKDTAIFTTYDSSKGLERKILVIFDFDYAYWLIRARCPDVDLAILRNIFLVAASRGKDEVIFVEDQWQQDAKKEIMAVADVKQYYLQSMSEVKHNVIPYEMSTMFDFKYVEEIEKCFDLLTVKRLDDNQASTIDICSSDGMIDLSPCIGIYQEASYFKNYKIDDEIEYAKKQAPAKAFQLKYVGKTLDEKVLALTAFQTGQLRYRIQVKTPFVTEEQKELIHKRLSTKFSGNETVQVDCDINENPPINGRIDVISDKGEIYELKFVSEVKHTHFLQLACYLYAKNEESGYLWNVKNDELYHVSIRDRKAFYRQMLKTIRKQK